MKIGSLFTYPNRANLYILTDKNECKLLKWPNKSYYVHNGNSALIPVTLSEAKKEWGIRHIPPWAQRFLGIELTKTINKVKLP